jgi:hypothetical protein
MVNSLLSVLPLLAWQGCARPPQFAAARGERCRAFQAGIPLSRSRRAVGSTGITRRGEASAARCTPAVSPASGTVLAGVSSLETPCE